MYAILCRVHILRVIVNNHYDFLFVSWPGAEDVRLPGSLWRVKEATNQEKMVRFIWSGKLELKVTIFHWNWMNQKCQIQPQPQDPRWLLRASTAVKAVECAVYKHFFLIFVSWNQSYTPYCPSSICGHVASEFICTKYWVSSVMANLHTTTFLTCTETWSTQIWCHSQLQLRLLK